MSSVSWGWQALRLLDEQGAVLRITNGDDARHPFVQDLVRGLPNDDSRPWLVAEGDIAFFWQRVERRGTPLLTQTDDGSIVATFVWRESEGSEIDTVVVSIDDAWIPLALIAGTPVWYADQVFTSPVAAPYCFHIGTDGQVFPEDVHEPWPMSFADPFNPWLVTEEDASYPRNVMRTEGLRERDALNGTVHLLEPPATLLRGPRVTSRFPVYIYEPLPALTTSDASLPMVVLMNGQFAESSDLLAQLDSAMTEGILPPSLVAIPGSRRGPDSFTAWGWRNGYGPHDLSPYLRHELIPALRKEFAFSPEIHLVAWSYAASAATRTSLRLDRIASVTLLHPEAVRSEDGSTIGLESTAAEVMRLVERGVTVQVADHRKGEPWIWGAAHRLTAGRANIVAAASGAVAALARVLPPPRG
ncbi:MAG: hypothetical protein IJO71_08380 [Microbacterium sp.]|uniref:hypothetical protein n=1 Tax=Microbacterium sp. TaxID=51671 RepID=UPI0025EC214C|nr:hypothetical protein [Microbacterium sp.]MBQ9917202.1 hypothetical protein [Microbacterium sp.]